MRLIKSTLAGILGLCVWPGNVSAINIEIDYRYDTTNFFGAGNPGGAAAGQMARNALEAAADYLSGIVTDTMSSISTPPTYYSQVSTGVVQYEWTAGFNNPSSTAFTVIADEPIAPNRYLVFAGARSLAGDTAGVGSPGSQGYSVAPTGLFSQQEIDEITLISDQFVSDVTTRGENSGFVAWGGSIAFDNDGSTTWWYNHTTSPGNNTADFYSIAIHELAHALGFGGSGWEAMVAGSINNYYFNGSASNTEYGGQPPVDNDKSHWASGTMSTVYGGTTAQETAMDPDITDGERKLFTRLDAAGLIDLGWTFIGDLNEDGFVGITDLNIVLSSWNQSVSSGNASAGDPSGDGYVGIEDLNTVLGNWNFGAPPIADAAVPEPASVLLLSLAATGLLGRKRHN